MAKRKPDELSDDVTFHGQSIDPEIQKKVDQYMDIDHPDTDASMPAAEIPATEAVVDEADAAASSSAPLLPTDQLPDSVKEPEAPVKKIAVTDADETETLPSAPELPDEEEDESTDLSDEEQAELDPQEDAPEELPLEEEAEKDTEDQLTESADQEIEPEVDTTQAEELPVEETPEPVAAIDAETIAAPDFEEQPVLDGKTIADAEKEAAMAIDDPQTAKAVDDIIAADADKLLDIEDEEKKDATVPTLKKPKKAKQGSLLKRWFSKPLYRNATIAAVVIGIIAAGAVPTSRYFLLNAAGVKVATSIRVLDDSTQLPLKNVELTVAGKSSKTDGDGNARVDGIPLGRQKLVIKKPAFAEVSREVTLGWGSNPLGDFSLTPVGSQYVFKVTNFLSGKPVTSGELNYEEASAQINEKGEAKITIEKINQEELEIEVTADDYRSEVVKVNTTLEQEYGVALVPSKQHVFFSKRSGKADLYKVDVDGKNEEVLLSGTGIERDDSLGIAPHPTKNITAFSSSRENVRNRDGFLLNTLQSIDMETKEVTKIAQSERIQIIDWSGDRLIYVKIAQGASQADTKRHRLMSYDSAAKTEKELASTNYFNDVLSVDGAIYYSPALYQVNGSVGLFKVNTDGTNRKTVFQKEVWNLFRTSYKTVSLSVGQDWYELNLANDEMKKVGGAPSVLKSRVYIKSPDGKRSIWIDERDGKTVLLIYDHASQKDSTLLTQSGIKNPVRWLDNNHIIYRIANGQETADFVINTGGGEPEKITDVMNSYGIDRWYYF